MRTSLLVTAVILASIISMGSPGRCQAAALVVGGAKDSRPIRGRASRGGAEALVRLEGERIALYTPTGGRLATLLAPEAGLGAPAASFEVIEAAAGRTRYRPTPAVPLAPLRFADSIRRGPETVLRYRAASFDVLLTLLSLPKKPYARLRLAVEWTGSAEPSPAGLGREVQVRLRLKLANAPARRGVSFPNLGLTTEPTDFQIRPPGFTAHWGCQGFRFEATDRTLNIPALAASANDKDYVVLLCEPRSAFTLGAKHDEMTVSRRLYVVPQPGAVDGSLDIGDGEQPAFHEFYLGYARDVTWDALYWDFYLDAFPVYARPPATPISNVNRTAMGAFPVTDRWLRRLYSFGNRVTGVGSIDNLEAYLEKTNRLRPDLPHRSGLKVSVGLDRYARDPKKEAGYGITEGWNPLFLWENVPDSLILKPDGQPIDSWSGMAVNMSTDFSYGRRVLDQLYSRISKQGYDGVWFDYYNDGEGYDPSHRYKQLPFYPTLVADTLFNRDLANWLHARGKFLGLNGPAPGLCFNRYYDVTSIDTSPVGMLRFKLQGVYKPFVALGGSTAKHPFTAQGWLEGGFRCFFFGGAIPAWAFDAVGSDSLWNACTFIMDVERTRPLFARNAFLGTRLASSAPLCGDYTTYRWACYGHPTGSIYVPVLNISSQPLHLRVPLSSPRIRLRTGQGYVLIDWDLEKGARLVARGMSAASLRRRGIEVSLEPGELRVFCIEPDKGAGALSLPYCAFLPGREPAVLAATDEVLQGGKGAGRARFRIQGLNGAQFEVRLWLGAPLHSFIRVAGMKAGCIRRQGNYARLWGEQSGPLEIALSPRQFPGSKGLRDGEVLRLRDDFAPARVVYEQVGYPSSWQLSGGWAIERNPLDGYPLFLSGASPEQAEAVLDTSVGTDHEFSFLLTRLAQPEPDWGRMRVEFLVAGVPGDEYTVELGWPETVLKHNREHIVASGGMYAFTYPSRYHRYVRDYGFRVRRRGARLAFAISYDHGDTWETLGEWMLPRADLAPRLGVRVTGTAARLEGARLVVPRARSNASAGEPGPPSLARGRSAGLRRFRSSGAGSRQYVWMKNR